MKKIKTFSAKTVNLPNEDIDTDQIIPARFLTRQTIDGIGECLFADWRFDKSGKPNENFILNKSNLLIINHSLLWIYHSYHYLH